MFISELFEKSIPVSTKSEWLGEKNFRVLENPSEQELLAAFEKSTYHEMRGLIVGNNVYWWDANDALHGEVAEILDPSYPRYDIDNRLELSTEIYRKPYINMYFDLVPKFLNNYQLQKILKSGNILIKIDGRIPKPYNIVRNDFLYETIDTLKPPEISVGDDVLIGKFKNKKAKITGFSKDDHKQPVLKTSKGDVKLFKPRIPKLDS